MAWTYIKNGFLPLFNLVNISYMAEKIVPKEHSSLRKKTLKNQSAVGLKIRRA